MKKMIVFLLLCLFTCRYARAQMSEASLMYFGWLSIAQNIAILFIVLEVMLLFYRTRHTINFYIFCMLYCIAVCCIGLQLVNNLAGPFVFADVMNILLPTEHITPVKVLFSLTIVSIGYLWYKNKRAAQKGSSL